MIILAELKIEPVYDSNGTSIVIYQVVDNNGMFWFQGTWEDCNNYINNATAITDHAF